ncbi:glycosyltransferase [Cellulomonas sp. ATA003]|uniref:glycosyltransferase n=1 Tax=Cellulomonas sp. ATA003 TaxID=3073064 RepID=UPI002873EDBA|nr:glycosyltransferase [Cellulomonas sp. ATA003]WNB87632.1 glycosyltransferase [Cellulomonas sp. ATA003]
MLLTAGTRGDIEPFLALARYAAARGHDVRLGMTEGAGMPSDVDAVGLGLDFRRVLAPPAARRGRSPGTSAARCVPGCGGCSPPRCGRPWRSLPTSWCTTR